MHPQPGGIGYQHWAGLVFGDGTGTRRPAPIITTWLSRQQDVPTEVRADARVFACGYDTDNMKARELLPDGSYRRVVRLPEQPPVRCQERFLELAAQNAQRTAPDGAPP